MPETDLRVSDAANAAALLRDAARLAPRGESRVETPYGTALVVKDATGTDVELDDGTTIHVRRRSRKTQPN